MLPRLPDAFAIAIVDDDAAVRCSTGGLLRSLGFCVIDYASGEEFLSADPSVSVDCILLDMRMPGRMNGLSVMRILRKRGSTIGVVVVTGRSDRLMAKAAARLGAVDVLEKPCRPHAMLNSIARAFAQTGFTVEAQFAYALPD
jgi:two-component system response regulator FixJ